MSWKFVFLFSCLENFIMVMDWARAHTHTRVTLLFVKDKWHRETPKTSVNGNWKGESRRDLNELVYFHLSCYLVLMCMSFSPFECMQRATDKIIESIPIQLYGWANKYTRNKTHRLVCLHCVQCDFLLFGRIFSSFKLNCVCEKNESSRKSATNQKGIVMT